MPAQAQTSSQTYAWLDHLPLPAVIIRDARFVYVNDPFLRLLGATAEQALGMRFDERVAPEDRPRVHERHQRRLRGEQVPNDYEFDIVRLDGERRTVEIFVSQNGEDTLFQLYDVTERAARDASLRALARIGASLQRELSIETIHRLVADGLGELGAVVLRVATAGDALRLADLASARRLAPDLPLVELARPWPAALATALAEGYHHLDDAPTTVGAWFGGAKAHELGAALAARRAHRCAVLRVDVPGAPAELLLVLAWWVRPEADATLSLFGVQLSAALEAARTVRDLSQRNAELMALNKVAASAGSSRELSSLFAQAAHEIAEATGAVSTVVFLIQGPHALLAYQHGSSAEAVRSFGTVTLAQSHFGEIVATRTAQVLRRSDFPELAQQMMARLGHEVVAAVPMLARSRVVGVLNAVFPNEKSFSKRELDLLTAMGVQLAAAVESTRMVDDLRKSYDDLSHTQAQLVQRERLAALGEMSAAVAHEVRNPLAVIFNSLAALRRTSTLDEGQRELLSMLTEESERIDHLVNDLLELARPTLPTLTAKAPLMPLLREAVAAGLATSRAQVELELVDDGQVGEVLMDPRLMRQVFLNLTVNAGQAMALGGRLTVRADRIDDELGPQVCIRFADTGGGIDAAVMPRIFEPFFTTRARGTGLGLTLVKRIVEAHRGKVTVRNAPGRGAELAVQWPLG